MRITEVHPQPDWVLSIVAEDSRVGRFDVSPYLEYEAFEELRVHDEFMKVSNGDTSSNGSAALICQRTPLTRDGWLSEKLLKIRWFDKYVTGLY